MKVTELSKIMKLMNKLLKIIDIVILYVLAWVLGFLGKCEIFYLDRCSRLDVKEVVTRHWRPLLKMMQCMRLQMKVELRMMVDADDQTT